LSVATLAACTGGEIFSGERDRVTSELASIPQHPQRRVCPMPGPGMMACSARVRLDAQGITPFAATASDGYAPSDLQSAYNIDTTKGAGATVAIVDAQDDPNAEKDLATYRSTYGLPACTSASGCFKKVNQSGSTSSLPQPDQGWAGEIMLDLEMASAACPNCKLLLVEASSASMNDFGAAENTAVQLGATVVSNSWGGSEDSSDTQLDAQYFNHPGVAIFVAAGDQGYGAEYPASSPYVTAVGGTTLAKSSSATRGWIEGVWGSANGNNGGTGSGCSSYESKPSWQKDSGCSHRTVADVAAVADPNTGVAVYDTYGGNGWEVYGGTSAASPLVAAIYALTGHGADNGSYAYGNPSAFYDVTSGTNGSCGGSYLCTAEAGYDGPTGNGSPNGAVLAGGSSGGGTPPGGGGTPPGSMPDGGTSGGGTPPGGGGGTPPGGSTCSHPICSSGGTLDPSCDSCAQSICAKDSYCCNVAWDNVCVGEVGSICGQSCSGGGGTGGGGTPPGGGSTCSHAICSSGKKLISSCDPCASAICSQDSYCCSTKWDSICVQEVGSICGESC
jgi:hypothetical protein